MDNATSNLNSDNDPVNQEENLSSDNNSWIVPINVGVKWNGFWQHKDKNDSNNHLAKCMLCQMTTDSRTDRFKKQIIHKCSQILTEEKLKDIKEVQESYNKESQKRANSLSS